MTVEITGDLLIGSTDSDGNRSLFARNPSTGEILEPPFVAATVDDVGRACDLAWKAFDAYRATSLRTRAAFLEKIADNVRDLGPTLIERAAAETGLPVFRLEGEFTRTVNQLRLFARVVRDGEWLDLRVDPAMPGRSPLPRPDLRLRQIPLGPVAVFGSSNFPLAFSVAGGDAASAFAAGCPVVVKGHLAHPGTGELVGRAVREAVLEFDLPEGTFSLVTGANDVGAALVRHPAIKAVGFTGSRMGGSALMAIAASRAEPIPVYAEMSSINPVYLLPEALASRAENLAKGFVASLTIAAGQLCTNPGLLIAIDSEGLDRFVDTAAKALVDNVPGPMLTEGIHASFDKGVAKLAEHESVRTLSRGQAAEGINRSPAAFFETTAAQFWDDPHLAEEIFGASGLLVRCKDFEEMLALTETLEGQLTATLQIEGTDFYEAEALIRVLERKVGRILANGWPTGVEVSDAIVHGGPFPATSDSRTTSVGTMSIRRFLRPVSYQNIPGLLLPPELQEDAIVRLPHQVNGVRVSPRKSYEEVEQEIMTAFQGA